MHSRKFLLSVKNMKAKTKNKILAVVVSATAIFLPSLLLGKWVEGFYFFVCHWFIREQFPKQYHHIVPSCCRLITSATFFFGVCFVFPNAVSMLSAIPINYFISWVGYTKKKADEYEIKYKELKTALESKKPFSTETCSEQELIERCKELRLSEENTRLAVEFFIKKTKQSIIADYLCINETSVAVRKKRLKDKLNN